MYRALTTVLLVTIWAGNSLAVAEYPLPNFSSPPSNIETIAQRISISNSVHDQSFLTGPLKDLAWNQPFYSSDTILEASLIDTPKFGLGLQGNQNLGNYEQNSQVLSKPSLLDNSYELGLFTQGRYGDYLFGTRFSKDITHGHQGVLGEFMAGYEKQLTDKLDFSLGVGTTWADDNYMASYSRTHAGQLTSSGLPLHTPNGGFKNASLTVTACYQLSDYWSLGAQVGYMRLLDKAAANPAQRDQESENIVTGFQLQYSLPGLAGGKFRNLLRPSCNNY